MNIHIVVIAFNTEPEMLDACVSSIHNAASGVQDEVEVLIVDNGSEEPVGDRGGQLTVIRSPTNLGFGRAVNLAVRQCRADAILLLNPDASLRPQTLRAFLESHRAFPNAVLSGHLRTSSGLQVDAYLDWNFSTVRRIRRGREKRRLEQLLTSNSIVPVPKICGGAMFGRRDLLLQYGPFDERFFLYGEDADLSRRLLDARVPLYLVGSAIVEHSAASSQRRFGTLVEESRADAAIRLATYHLVWPYAMLQRLELTAVTLLGLLATRTSSSSRRSRVARLRQVRRWSWHRDLPALDPADSPQRPRMDGRG